MLQSKEKPRNSQLHNRKKTIIREIRTTSQLGMVIKKSLRKFKTNIKFTLQEIHSKTVQNLI